MNSLTLQILRACMLDRLPPNTVKSCGKDEGEGGGGGRGGEVGSGRDGEDQVGGGGGDDGGDGGGRGEGWVYLTKDEDWSSIDQSLTCDHPITWKLSHEQQQSMLDPSHLCMTSGLNHLLARVVHTKVSTCMLDKHIILSK